MKTFKLMTTYTAMMVIGSILSPSLHANFWRDVGSSVKDVAKKAERDIKRIPKDVKREVEDVGKDIEDVTETVGESRTVQHGKEATEKMKQLGIDTAEAAKKGFAAFGKEILEQALIVAAITGDKADVEGLLEYDGVDINARGSGNITALMMAAYHQHGEIVDYLIEHNAKINLTDEACLSALSYAKDPFIKPAKGPLGANQRSLKKYIIKRIKDAGGHEFKKVNGTCVIK